MSDLDPLYVTPSTPGALTYGPAAAALMGWERRPPMPWQSDALNRALEVDEEGRWRHRTVVVTVPRQNGKTTPCRAVVRHRLLDPAASGWEMGDLVDVLGVADERELARETWSIVTRSFEAAGRAKYLAHKPRRANGDETLGLVTGGRYRIAAANENAGHGWPLDLVWLDELWNIGRRRRTRCPPRATGPTEPSNVDHVNGRHRRLRVVALVGGTRPRRCARCLPHRVRRRPRRRPGRPRDVGESKPGPRSHAPRQRTRRRLPDERPRRV